MIKRNMSLIVSNQFFTTIADSIFDITILWYAYQISGSALFASFVTAISAITSILIGPIIGVFIDRTEPKTSMQVGYAIMIFIGVVLTVIYFTNIDLILVFIYVAIILQNICMLTIGPAKNKLLPRIVGEGRIIKVNGYISSTSQTAILIGQASSGLLIGLIGFAGVMLGHAGVYLIASILLIFVINPKKVRNQVSHEDKGEGGESRKEKFLREFKEGFSVIKGNKALLKLVLLGMAVNMTTVAGSLIVVLVSDQYQASAIQFGLLNAAGACAGIVIGFFAERIAYLLKANVMYGMVYLIAGLGFLGAGLTTNYYVGSFFFIVIVTSSIIMNIISGSFFIFLVKDELRGRVFTLIGAISTLLMPLLAIAGGFIADLFEVGYLFIFAGVWTFLCGIVPFIDKDIRSIELAPRERVSNF